MVGFSGFTPCTAILFSLSKVKPAGVAIRAGMGANGALTRKVGALALALLAVSGWQATDGPPPPLAEPEDGIARNTRNRGRRFRQEQGVEVR